MKSVYLRVLATASMISLATLWPYQAQAQSQATPVIEVASGVKYQLIGRWDVDKLNTILKKDTPAFAGISVEYTPARNAVLL